MEQRQLIRETPLETTTISIGDDTVTVPSATEMLRIKAILILKRNATRDYLDFIAMANALGNEKACHFLTTRCLTSIPKEPSRCATES